VGEASVVVLRLDVSSGEAAALRAGGEGREPMKSTRRIHEAPWWIVATATASLLACTAPEEERAAPPSAPPAAEAGLTWVGDEERLEPADRVDRWLPAGSGELSFRWTTDDAAESCRESASASAVPWTGGPLTPGLVRTGRPLDGLRQARAEPGTPVRVSAESDGRVLVIQVQRLPERVYAVRLRCGRGGPGPVPMLEVAIPLLVGRAADAPDGAGLRAARRLRLGIAQWVVGLPGGVRTGLAARLATGDGSPAPALAADASADGGTLVIRTLAPLFPEQVYVLHVGPVSDVFDRSAAAAPAAVDAFRTPAVMLEGPGEEAPLWLNAAGRIHVVARVRAGAAVSALLASGPVQERLELGDEIRTSLADGSERVTGDLAPSAAFAAAAGGSPGAPASRLVLSAEAPAGVLGFEPTPRLLPSPGPVPKRPTSDREDVEVCAGCGPSVDVSVDRFPPNVRGVHVQDVDTMDGRIDQLCLDGDPDVASFRWRVAAGAWSGWWGSTIGFTRRGVLRICLWDQAVAATDPAEVALELQVQDSAGNASVVFPAAARCERTPSRHIALDGRGLAVAVDLRGRPHVVSATRRGLRYSRWDGASWQDEWIDCLEEGSASPACPARPDWLHDYGLQAGIALDFAQRPIVCFVKGERTVLDEAVFGDNTRYSAPALPLLDAPATAYVAWRVRLASGGFEWRTRALGSPGEARLYGCSIASIDRTDSAVVSWSEMYNVAGTDRVPWPRYAHLVGPTDWNGDPAVEQSGYLPRIWEGSITCRSDVECGSATCDIPPGGTEGTCAVLEGTSASLAAHFVSAAGGAWWPGDPSFRAYFAYDIAAGRIYLSQLTLESSGEGYAASWTTEGVAPSDTTVWGTMVEDVRSVGLRPALAVRELGPAGQGRTEAIAFSLLRTDPTREADDSERNGWTPAVFYRTGRLDSDPFVRPWLWQVHEDAMALHASPDPTSYERLLTPTHRLSGLGLPQWIGITRRDVRMRQLFSLEGRLLTTDDALVEPQAPLRALFAATWSADPDYPAFSYALVDGGVLVHNGLQGWLSAGDSIRAVFENALSPIALGNPRPASGDPPDWDLAVFGTANYWEEESGAAFGSDLWGSPRLPCFGRINCADPDPPPPDVPRFVAGCKASKFATLEGDARVTDAEMMLVPRLEPSVEALATAWATPGDARGPALVAALRDFLADLRSFYGPGFLAALDALPETMFGVPARAVAAVASVLQTLAGGGTLPEEIADDVPAGVDPALVQVPVAAGSSPLATIWGEKRILNRQPVSSRQSYVCRPTGEATGPQPPETAEAPQLGRPERYSASPVRELGRWEDFRTALAEDRRGLAPDDAGFATWCAVASSPDRDLRQSQQLDTGGGPSGELAVVSQVVELAAGRTCVGCPGEATIAVEGGAAFCDGCRKGRLAFRGGERICVDREQPAAAPPPDPPPDPPPARSPVESTWEFSRFQGRWHRCPGDGVTTAETIAIPCLFDDQCSEVGSSFRCHAGRCRAVAPCDPAAPTASGCDEGYRCEYGASWESPGGVCVLDRVCEGLLGGICLPEGPCAGMACERLYFDCTQPPGVPGGGSCTAGVEGPQTICRNRDVLQHLEYEYTCLDKARLSCPGITYCDPDSAASCPVGTACQQGPVDSPWCPLREVVRDDRFASAQSNLGLMEDSTATSDVSSSQMLRTISALLGERPLVQSLEQLEATTFIPQFSDYDVDWNERFGPPEIRFRGHELVPGVPIQGELVISLGQDEDFFVDGPGSCNITLAGPWRLQLTFQPYTFAGETHWAFSRLLLVDPRSGARRTFDAGCSCVDDAAGKMQSKIDGMEDPLSDQLNALAEGLWRTVAQEPATAALLFGNAALLEALDVNVDDDDEEYPDPDEIFGVRVETGSAAVQAVER
jgi:hypothetical protein